MSSRESSREADDVALRDLVVGEPAVHRVLDGEAARAKADRVVREASADPRIAAVVERIGDAAAAQPEAGDASVRESPGEASEVQRVTQRVAPARQVTSPNLDTHKRVTDPRLDPRSLAGPHVHDAPLDEVGEAVERARRSLRASAGQSRTDHQRLAVLGATALAVGLILLALLLTRGSDRRPTAPTTGSPADTADEPGIIPVETVLPGPPSSTSGAATPPTTPSVPSSGSTTQPAPSSTPATPPRSADPPPRDGARPPGMETNPKSSAPKPGPSQDVPAPNPKPSSDRPF